MTIWKPVRGFSPYEISNLGEVRNPTTGNLLKIGKDNKYKLSGKRISLVKLMRENHPYEWIKYLEEGEEVKPLKEYPEYFITSLGRLWSMESYRFLLPYKSKQYELHHQYQVGGVSGKRHTIHTLVGRNFLPEYREGLCVLHKEETLSYPEIHYVNNLWVGTLKDNTRDMIEKGRDRFGGRDK